MDVLQEFEYRGYNIEIKVDEDPMNPRDEDPLGTIAYAHKSYILGEEEINTSNFEGWEDVEENYIEDGVVIPVYMLDHGGITLSTTPFGDPWDSGQVGIIYVTKDKMEEEGLTEDHTRNVLEAEIRELDKFVRGEHRCFRITKDGEEVDDLCGLPDSESAEEEAKQIVDSDIEEKEETEKIVHY